MIYNNEKMICDNIDQRDFFKALQSKGYTPDVLTMLFDEENFETIDKFDFNGVIRSINEIDKIPMFDMLVFLEKNIADPKKVIGILDPRNMAILKKEAEKSHNIKLPKCSLSEFFSG
jgi:hypothetical protein